MLTPKFDITQNDVFVIVTMHVPYIKISDSEIYIEGTEFKFYLKPYYLRLNFNQEITEDGTEHAQYDVEKGDIVIHIPKKNQGENFKDLNMINKLLSPKCVATPPNIQILTEENVEKSSSDEEDFNLEWEQNYPTNPDSVHICYGFCNEYSNFYGPLVTEFPDLLDIPHPDQVSAQNRKALIDDNLLESFDMEHYLSDFMDINDFVGDVIHYQPRYITNPDNFTLVGDEQALLCQLPSKHIHVGLENIKNTMVGLVDILYSFIFDHLINCGEISVESAWNICKLSSQLSWLYIPNSLRECLILNYSRSLTFPLYRHFDFCSRVFEDIKFIISGGKSCILKCLLGILDILRHHEFYYLHNKVFISNYCLWIQDISDKHIEKLSETLNSMKIISKTDLPFPLEEFEAYIDTCSSEESDFEASSEYETHSSDNEDISDSEHVHVTNKQFNGKQSLKIPQFNDIFSDDCQLESLNTAIDSIALTDDGSQSSAERYIQKPLIEELDTESNI